MKGMSELRYSPFLGQWVMVATHRQDRTFHPPDDYCPLCPTTPGGFVTEIPLESYDIAVFENRFPSLSSPAPEPAVSGTPLMPVRPSEGCCEVICYTQDHTASMAALPPSQVRKLVRVWRDRYMELASREEVQYVFIFENKGKEIGVTLSHPHGQIYAYPFIPPTLELELRNEREHWERTGRTLWEDWLREELDPGLTTNRTVTRNEDFVAIVPFFARYPFEVWIVPLGHLASLRDMSDHTLDHLAEILHDVTRRYDALFGFSLPYIMALHQEPAVPGYGFTRFHIEFYPPHRTADKLKYLAGSEAGAGAFINDTAPEESAAKLRNLRL